ncbi:hypothetical protein [Acrocarpospora sp. B8E8]|uniref:hypothetical protein n=1 Tax=Acrocarpospora sp. B8E8 TaxID=3153572 RepID=UPI00325C4D65
MSNNYPWIPDGSSAGDWQSSIEVGARDTGTAEPLSVAADPITVAHVAAVDCYAISYHDQPWKPGDPVGSELELTAILRLTDGRWASVESWNDYTGWDCRDGSTIRIGADRDSVIRWGLTESGRARLGLGGVL